MSAKEKLAQLLAQQKAQEEKYKYTSDRVKTWNIKAGKEGTNTVVLRFLEAHPDFKYQLPVGEYHRHFFQNKKTGLYYVENCPQRLRKKCPACDKFWELRNAGNDEASRQFSRQVRYFANVYIVDDKQYPENNGTVQLFEFGGQIFNMLKNTYDPTFDPELDDEPQEPFYPYGVDDGANFQFKVYTRTINNRPTPQYDKSKFDKPSSLGLSKSEKEVILNSMIDFSGMVDDGIYKSYDDLIKRFNEVEGVSSKPEPKKSAPKNDEFDEDDDNLGFDSEEFNFD